MLCKTIAQVSLLALGALGALDKKQCNCDRSLAEENVYCGKAGPFPNVCSANCAGFGKSECGFTEEPCPCSRIYKPVVCGIKKKEYNSPCQAECDGWNDSKDCVPLTEDNCRCTKEYAPVKCGGNDFDNMCRAKCANVDVKSCVPNPDKADTGCVCPQNYEPVTCGKKQYTNLCKARCDKVDLKSCIPDNDKPCICAEIYAPVMCGKKQYSNKCEAGCAGAKKCKPLKEKPDDGKKNDDKKKNKPGKKDCQQTKELMPVVCSAKKCAAFPNKSAAKCKKMKNCKAVNGGVFKNKKKIAAVIKKCNKLSKVEKQVAELKKKNGKVGKKAKKNLNKAKTAFKKALMGKK